VILRQALIVMVLVVMRLYMLVLVAGCQRCRVLGNIMETTRGMGVVIDMQQITQLAILLHGIDLYT
jgi:hypothetical protein